MAYNWALAVPLSRRHIDLLAEVNGNLGPNSEMNRVAVAAGIRYSFDSSTSVGVAVPIGLTRHTERVGIVTQFQFGYRW